MVHEQIAEGRSVRPHHLGGGILSIQFIDEMLQDVADEIRTTKDRVRLAELGAVRAFLKAKQSELFDEMEGEEL